MRIVYENNHVPVRGKYKDVLLEDIALGKNYLYDCAGTYALLDRKGDKGETGPGVPTGGTAGQVLTKNGPDDFDTSWINPPVVSVNGKTGAVVLNKVDVGLGNVDNTSDVNKPISTATQTALNGKASALTNTGDQTLSIAGSNLTISGPNGNTVPLPSSATPTGAAGGDLSGSYPNPGVVGAHFGPDGFYMTDSAGTTWHITIDTFGEFHSEPSGLTGQPIGLLLALTYA